ncbi:MAG: hypothetical protein JW969_02100 [Spirochaetales bacterium]|nr:hypothetical protein [Spirochaetales bacterium]
MKKIAVQLVCIIIAFAGCVSGPDADSDSVNTINTVFEKPASTIKYESSGKFIPVQQGQWVTLRKYEGNDKVIFKYSVYNDKDTNTWIEIQDIRSGKEIIVQYQITNLNAKSINELGIIKGHYYMNKRQMDNVAMMMTTYLIPIFPPVNLEKLNLTITTPGGIFEHVYGKSGSTSIDYSFESENVSISIKDMQSGTMFYHPALPLNGLVGWKSTKDNAEVVDFGFSGAEPAVEL